MDKQKGHLQSVWHPSLFICFGTLPFIYLLPFLFIFFLLQITPESENDFGSYNCTASNEMGTESKEFLLIQAGELWFIVLCRFEFICVWFFSMISIWKLFDDRKTSNVGCLFSINA